jgi:hypothetical protein
MANSTEFTKTQQSVKPRSRQKKGPAKPDKPYPDFPLFPHATKRWAKKILGKLHYFGPWNDPQGALARYQEQRDDLHAGRKPRPTGEGFNLKALANAFLNSKRLAVEAGELTQRSHDDYRAVCGLIIEAFTEGRLVSDLTPDDFEAFRAKLSKTRGSVTLGNTIQRIRVVFKFAADNGLIPQPVHYGQGFKRPSKKRLRLEREARGPKMFEACEIRAMLAQAGQPLRAMFLLGVNAGLGNADVGSTWTAAG